MNTKKYQTNRLIRKQQKKANKLQWNLLLIGSARHWEAQAQFLREKKKIMGNKINKLTKKSKICFLSSWLRICFAHNRLKLQFVVSDATQKIEFFDSSNFIVIDFVLYKHSYSVYNKLVADIMVATTVVFIIFASSN